MPHCVAPNCYIRSFLKSKKQEELEENVKITFHRFPTNESRRLVWIEALGLDPAKVAIKSSLCSLHFREEDIDRSSSKITRLTKHAIPLASAYQSTDEEHLEEPLQAPMSTEYLASSCQNTNVLSLKEQICYKLASTIIAAVAVMRTICTSEVHERSEVMQSVGPFAEEELRETEIAFRTSPSTQFIRKRCREEEANEYNISRKKKCYSKSDPSYQSLEDTPRKIMLRKTLQHTTKMYQRKLATLRTKNRRQEVRIAKLNTMIQELKAKNLLQDEHAAILREISKCNLPLFQRFIVQSHKVHDNNTKKQKHTLLTSRTKRNKELTATSKAYVLRKQYDPLIRKFALTMHYYSPKAYDYLRKQFNLCLPHPRSISRWYQTINGNPGFITEAFNSIRSRVKVTKYPLVGTLVFDEMSIRHHTDLTTTTDGYVDFGDGVGRDNNCMATQALMFLFVCMNGAWKVPVGYFLIDGISAEQKCNLVEQCLRLLHDAGVFVVPLTCDGASANISMMKLLGCNLKVQSLKTWFPHPITKQKVFVFMDPCHMIKLVRTY